MRYIIASLLALLLVAETALAVSPPISLSQNPRVGGAVGIITNCGSTAAGGIAVISLDQNGSSAILPAVGNKIQTDGSMNALAGIPTSVEAGLVGLVVTCPNGVIIKSLVIIDPALPDGTIIKGTAPTVYLIMGGRKFGIPSLTVFYRLGLSFGNLIILNDADLQNYPDGGVQN